MVIKQKKWQTFWAFVLLLGASALFIFFGFFDVRYIFLERYGIVLYYILKFLCIILLPVLLFATLYYLKQLFSKKNLIEITFDAFIDNSSATSFGEISWSDIKSAKLKGMFLVVELIDPEKYLNKMGPIKRAIIKLNKKIGYEYACISFTRIKHQAQEFLEKFNKKVKISNFESKRDG